ncbi:uncharacterized protein LOC131952514 isoform X2 [Physella acuta]|uniref:uncharacterized protein LOC131952514 isoform X2 n=1 Tax=Physella acuta TaxID=109671 RepID=UPI0027DC9DAA|nr:uncharacterized protein LOC131952514 isoform X2 [Physella acuta]
MDGHASSHGVTHASSVESDDESADQRYSDSEMASIDRNMEQLRMLDDDFEQPDGQRSSLSLDDDGGTHFESHSQEGLSRRGGPARDGNNASPVHHGSSDDNDSLFNPLQRLNFDDDVYDDEESAEDVGNREDNEENEHLEAEAAVKDNPNVDEYMHHRPAVNGSDVSEHGLYGGAMSAHDQGQNVRIIEGHDSSILDNGGNSLYGFSFLPSQMGQQPLLSPANSAGGAGNPRPDEDSQNLYDSLEREDGSSHYGDEHMMENNSSEYYSAGNMTLMATNSQGPDNDVMWAQDDPTDQTSYLSSHHQHFQHLVDPSQQQGPPRNFQVEQPGSFKATRQNGSYRGEGNMGGFGDVHSNEEDNTDALSLELSEEGLLQSTQMYAQPVSNNMAGNSGQHQFPKDWNSNWPQANGSSNQNASFDLIDSIRSQPKNLLRNQAPIKVDAVDIHDEGDGVDSQTDQRQAGAGSSLAVTDQNQSAGDSGKAGKKSASNKVQTRRPAVQGSASSGEKKAGAVATRSSAPSTSIRKSSPATKPGNHGGSSAVGRHKPGEPAKAVVNAQVRPPQAHSSMPNMLQISTANSTNSRVSGVGKESYLNNSSQMQSARGNCQLIVGTENNISPLPQREDVGQSEVTHPPHNAVHANVSSTAMPKPQPSHPQFSQSFDRIRTQPNQHQMDVRSSQSYIKQPLMVFSSNHSLASSQSNYSGDQQSAIHRLNENYNRGNMSSSSVSLPQRQASNSQQLHSSFSQISPYTQGDALNYFDGNHQNSIRDMGANQVEGYKKFGHKLPENAEHDIHGMEDVRAHMHNMLRVGADLSSNHMAEHTLFDPTDTASDLLISDQPIKRQLHFDPDITSIMGNNNQDDMSDILENFPTFSSKIFLDLPSLSNRTEAVIQGENQYLRDNLEKEKYRRKHCEEQIHKLNTKILEIQQQLAVAVSTDKRKDLMIEQLDKQLAKVVEGWKKREAEKDDFLRVLTHEKEQIEENLQSQQNMINSFEKELAQTVDQLKAEKETSSQAINCLKDELYEVQRSKEQAAEEFEAERSKFNKMTAEWNDLSEARDLAERQAQQAQERLISEQDNWSKREQELLAKIDEVKEANQKVISMEKVKLESQKKKLDAANEECEQLKAELKKTVLDFEQLIREKESQKVEMAIMEAKFESAQRKLETDLHAQMEKEIADQASEFHMRIETALEEAAERYQKQLSELNSRHQKEMERQSVALTEERLKKEEDFRKHINELEEKLQELRTENHHLRQSKIKLESQRMEILTKLQFMMQSQWNEAVSLLVSTPQKKGLNSSFMSSQNGGQLASALAVADGNTSVASLNLATSGPATLADQGNESQERATSSPQLHQNIDNENGREDRRDEINKMGRVEEYLQKLSSNMDIPMTRNELQVPQVTQSSDQSSSYGTCSRISLATSEDKMTYPYHGQFHHQPTSDRGSSDDNKPSNNLSHSQLPRVHGYVTGPSGNTIITTSGHLTNGHRTQSLQELTSAPSPKSSIHSESSHHSLKTSTDNNPPANHQYPPANHPYLINSSYGAGFPPPHLNQYGQNRQQAATHLPPRQTHNSSQHSTLGFQSSPLTGDYGDHKQLKNAASRGSNKNIYDPESPTVTPSPSELSTEPWSPAAQARPFYGTNKAATTLLRSATTLGSLQVLGSPQRKSRHGLSKAEKLNESLSPPVKQTSDRQQAENMSQSIGETVNSERMQTKYGQILDSMEEHQSRQGELQHYVRMLLQKAPGSVCSEPERDVHSELDVLESSRDLTVDLDLNDTATAAELTSQLNRLHHLREHQSTRMFHTQEGGLSQMTGTSHLLDVSDGVGDNGAINSQRLSEISQLLATYRTEPDDKKAQDEAKSQNQARKVKEAKVKKVRIASQSAETGTPPESRDKPTAAKPVSLNKKAQPSPDPSKEKKPAGTKAAGGKGTAGIGPAWK